MVNIEQAKELVIAVVSSVIKHEAEILESMQLIGGESILDSMQLVEICLALEDVAEEYGFQFDWTSDATMSKSRSMFRSVATLAQEFTNQSTTSL